MSKPFLVWAALILLWRAFLWRYPQHTPQTSLSSWVWVTGFGLWCGFVWWFANS